MGAAVLTPRCTYFAVLTFGMTELIMYAVTSVEKKSYSAHVECVLTGGAGERHHHLTGAAVAVLTSIVLRRSRFGLAFGGIGSH